MPSNGRDHLTSSTRVQLHYLLRKMNWVGGARSRVRQKSERKAQKDFFERKRLQAKATKTTTHSSHVRPKQVISQDLLFLQTLSNAHGKSRELAVEPPKQPQRIDLTAAEKGFKKFNLDLTLPMSPIGKPSSLDLMDTSCSLSFFYSDDTQPKVSTQKLPHNTAVDDFCPPVSRDPEAVKLMGGVKGKFKTTREPITAERCRKPAHNTSSCLTESIFPPTKRPKLGTDYSIHELAEQGWTWETQTHNGHVTEQSRHLEKVDGATQHGEDESRSSTRAGMGITLEELLSIKPGKGPEMTQHSKFEESFDSETPFQSRHTRTQLANEKCAIKLKTQTDLLHFQQREGGSKAKCSKDCRSLSASSLLDEVPLITVSQREDGGRGLSVLNSTATIFNESIFGPIYEARSKPHDSSQCVKDGEQQKEQENRNGREKRESAFERMMHSFESSGSASSDKPATMTVDREERKKGNRQKVQNGREERQEKQSGRHGLHSKWRSFVTGAHAQPTTSDNVISTSKQNIIKPIKYKGALSNQNSSKHHKSKTLHGFSTVRNKNASALEELLCLDEELTSSLESDAVSPSQDFTLTPGLALNLTEDPFKSACVPDIDHYDRSPVVNCHCESSQESQHNPGTNTREHTPRSHTPSPLTSTGSPVKNTRLQSRSADMPAMAHGARGGVNPEAYTCGCDAVTQTEPSRAVLCREVSSECDIWIKDMIHLPAMVHSVGVQVTVAKHQTLVDTAIQTECADSGGNEETVLALTLSSDKDLNTEDSCMNCETMARNTDLVATDDFVKFNAESHWLSQCAVDNGGSAQLPSKSEHTPSDPERPVPAEASSIAVQVSLDEPVLTDLRQTVAHLQRKLEESTNALIWQSLKLKLLEMG